MIEIVIFLVFLGVGYGAGTYNERRHLASLREREASSVNLPVLSLKQYDPNREVVEATLVTGSVVVSIDYFKRVASMLRSYVGGRIASCETLVDRARREALLRMKEQAAGYDLVINSRLETSSIGGESSKKKSVVSIEVIAYGTAIRYRT